MTFKLDSDFVCPETYCYIDSDTCESFCFGEGCRLLKDCRAYKCYIDGGAL